MEFEKKERISIRSKRLTSAVLAVSLMATSTFAGIGPALAHVKDFSDTNSNAWYAHPVTFVSDNKYMVGYGGTDKFGIGENLTRAELAAILANYKGVKLDKDTTNKTGLSDIKDHKWYTAVCNWAVKEKLVVGYEDGTFRPNAPISREEIAAILCRFVDGEMGIDKELQTFPDKYSIGDWAWGSYEWATHYGVIFGIKEADGVYLRPKSNVTREQMAAMVERLHEYIKEYGYGYREDEDKPNQPSKPDKPSKPSKPSGPSYVNHAPSTPNVTASFDLDQAHVKNPYTKDAAILLNKTAQSTDPDGDPITYEWDMGKVKIDKDGYCKVSDLLELHHNNGTNLIIKAQAKDNHGGVSEWGQTTIDSKKFEDFLKGINQSITLTVPTSVFTNEETAITLTNENLKDKPITWLIEKDGKEIDFSQLGKLNNSGGNLTFNEEGQYKITAKTLNLVGQTVKDSKTIDVSAQAIINGSMTLEAPEYIKQDEATVLTLAPKDMDNGSIQWTITKDGQPFDYSQAGSLTDQGGNLNLTEMGHYEITATGTDLGGKEVTVNKTVNVESKFWQITPDGEISPSEKTKINGPYYAEFCNQDGLTIPDTFMGVKVSGIGNDAFKQFKVKGTLTLPKGLQSIGNSAFYYCNGLTGTLNIPDSVASIGSSAFYQCKSLTGSLTIPDGVTEIGQYTFAGCSGLTGTLTIPEGVINIDNYAFYFCYGLTGTLTLPKGLQTIGQDAFSNCSGFTGSLTIPDSVTSIDNYAFNYCSGFNGTLTLSKGLESIGKWAFKYCNGFTGSLTIPDSVTSIDNYAFENCTGFNGTLALSKSLESIGKEAFENCSGFTGSLAIPDNVTSIGDCAFNDCSGFNGTLTLPEGLQSIGQEAFRNCSGFTGSLTIPQSLTKIGLRSFIICNFTSYNWNNKSYPTYSHFLIAFGEAGNHAI